MNSKKSTLTWVLYGLFVVCIALRFVHLDAMEFKSDEYIVVKMAFDNIHHGLALIGLPASTRLNNPPFFIYLISLPVLFTSSPVAITVFVLLFNTAGLIILVLLLRRFFPEEMALLMVVLFASAPWALVFSRKIWPPDCLLPFMAGIFWLMTDLKERYRSWKVWAVALLLAIVSQLHMSAWFLPFGLIAFILLNRVKIKVTDMMIGLSALVISYVPYIAFHFQTHFQNIGAFLAMRRSQPYGSINLRNFQYSLDVSTGVNFRYLLGRDGLAWFYQHYHADLAVVVFFIYELACVAALLWAGFKATKNAIAAGTTGRGHQTADDLILLFVSIFFVIQGFYAFARISAYPHYGVIFYPLVTVILVHALFEWFQSANARRWVKAALMVVVGAHLFFSMSFLDMTKNHPEKIDGDYGKPYFTDKAYWQKTLNENLK
jgi:hypothetical protein